ncbi:SGNH/GDSL hydrolase family protein [Halobacillus sp. Marseille-Q1614]|uniref:SGNH/GDSL hydrolase family protein n=1 Tax=Halobacillus sp. Marseille-Q1614 TaxID=2709134 RepID=UPI0020C3B7E3|nr:SGNH/GDSL hydrolase family protein [Halobacillus sp. Marseille-Q1614]
MNKKGKLKMRRRALYILIGIIIISFYFINVAWIGKDDDGASSLETEIKTVKGDWVGAWAASMQAPFEDGVSHKGFKDQTVRMVVHPQMDGDQMRIRLSNAFGEEPLTIEKVHAAVSKGGAEIDPDTDQKITFDGKEKVTIPPGEKKFSDPIPLKVKSEKELAVSIYANEKTGPATWHPRSMQTNYISSGDHVSEAGASNFETEEESWFWLEAVDVTADPSVKGALVVLGSSIANGNYSEIDANNRWPDYLADRMNSEDAEVKMSVLNAGISANQLINSPPEKGENALDRLDRDVFSQTGVEGVILHQGLNDIRHHPDYDSEKIIEQMKKVIDATHDKGLKIYGGTLTPFKGSSMYTEKGEKTRQEVNEWIRTSGEFDGVIDFDKAVRDPEEPKRFLPEYDAGDNLHPNDEGYKKIAETIDLSIFEE